MMHQIWELWSYDKLSINFFGRASGHIMTTNKFKTVHSFRLVDIAITFRYPFSSKTTLKIHLTIYPTKCTFNTIDKWALIAHKWIVKRTSSVTSFYMKHHITEIYKNDLKKIFCFHLWYIFCPIVVTSVANEIFFF